MVNSLLDENGRPRYEGVSPEATTSLAINQPGIYEAKGADGETKRLITAHGAAGVPQADAFVRLGFKWVGPVPSPQEIRDMQAKQLAETKAEEPETKLALTQVPELLKRLEEAEKKIKEFEHSSSSEPDEPKTTTKK